jgi:hypothetical protein
LKYQARTAVPNLFALPYPLNTQKYQARTAVPNQKYQARTAVPNQKYQARTAVPNIFALPYPLNTLFILEYPLHSETKMILNKITGNKHKILFL